MKLKKYTQILGELEKEIMEVVWNLQSASVRDVVTRLNKSRKVAYTTVMTVMGRLADKGILKRKFTEQNAYLYSPAESRQSFFASVSKNAVNSLIEEFGEVAVAQFIDVIGHSNRRELREWQKKLKKVK